MEQIIEHIIKVISREEKGSILSYNILSNMAINMVLVGATPEEIIECIDELIIEPQKRKLE